MEFCLIPEKEAAGTRLWAVNGHYMGLNLGVFSGIERFNGPDLLPLESDGFTGVFWKNPDRIALRFTPSPLTLGVARAPRRALAGPSLGK
jgi:hypothetical protein